MPPFPLLNLPADVVEQIAQRLPYRDLLALFLARPSLRHTIPLSPRQALEASAECASWCLRHAGGRAQLYQRVRDILRPLLFRAPDGHASLTAVRQGACVESTLGVTGRCGGLRITGCLPLAEPRPLGAETVTWTVVASPSVMLHMDHVWRSRQPGLVGDWEIRAFVFLPAAPPAEPPSWREAVEEVARATAASITLVPRYEPSRVRRVSVECLLGERVLRAFEWRRAAAAAGVQQNGGDGGLGDAFRAASLLA